MTPKTFAGLALVTAAVAAGAAYGVFARYGTTGGGAAETTLFPDLAGKINTVNEMSVQNAEGTVVLKRTEAGWRVATTYDYPAMDATVREAIIGVSNLKLVDAKTKMPERFARLDVDDVTAKDSKSRLYRLKDGAGTLVAEVLMGRRRFDLGGDEENGVYVRKTGEQQAWLARAKVPADNGVMTWIDRKIVDIRKRRIKRVTTVDADGLALTAMRQDPDAEDYVVENLPEGFQLKDRWQWDVNGMGLTLTGMQFDAVMPVAETGKDFSAPGVERAVIETHGGLILRIAMLKGDDSAGTPWWLTVVADVDPGAKAEPSGEGADRIGTPEEIQKEAQDINAKVKGWAYQLSDSQIRSLRVRLADLKAPPRGS